MPNSFQRLIKINVLLRSRLFPPDGFLRPQDGSKMAQEGPKRGPREPQRRSQDRRRAFQERIYLFSHLLFEAARVFISIHWQGRPQFLPFDPALPGPKLRRGSGKGREAGDEKRGGEGVRERRTRRRGGGGGGGGGEGGGGRQERARMSPALSLLRVWHPPPSLGEVPGVCRILFRLLLARLRFGLLFGFDLAARAKRVSFSSPRARAGASSGRARGADEKGGRKGEDPSRRQPENTSVASRRLGMARLMREQCPLGIPLPVMYLLGG